MPRVFIAGLIEGYNYPNNTDKPLLDTDKCNDLIIVDRQYFIKNFGFIYAWALSVEKKESVIEDVAV